MVRDVAVAVRHYARLGFALAFEDSPTTPRYAAVRRDGVELHLQWHDESAWSHPGDRPTYRFVVDDVDALSEELASVPDLDRTAVRDTPWGTREFHVRDPDGNGLQFYAGRALRDQVGDVVRRYIDAVRRTAPAELPLHPDVVGEFPTNTYRGAEAYRGAVEPFTRIVKQIDVTRLVVDGEHCVALLDIDTVHGRILFAEHIHVVNGQIVSVRGYYDPRPMLDAATRAD